MQKKFFLISPVIALIFAVAPMSSFAGMGADESFNIYGWQNWSYEWVENDNTDRDVDRLSNNAANIGFMAHMDTGIDGLQVGFRCEQFTYWGRLNNYTGWCNRNSKISLRHETAGEIMFGQWLLPYNEIVAAWIDPFYDAGADSHTSLMGNIGVYRSANASGLESSFYNGSFSNDFGTTYGSLSFNRRQEGIVQYVWPNTSEMNNQAREGFQFRFAVTEGSATDNKNERGGATRDPRIWSTGASYTYKMANGGALWGAIAYEKHDDISAVAGIDLRATGALQCDESDDDGWRLATRYTHDWGNGMSSQLGGMYENLEYEGNGCTTASQTPLQAELYAAERDAWMVSGKHAFGNGFDVRFSYMDADEWDCDGGNAACVDEDTDAQAYNVGAFYTMPAGTELRLTYSEIDNETNAAYNFGINGVSGFTTGGDVSMLAVGIVHWFD